MEVHLTSVSRSVAPMSTWAPTAVNRGSVSPVAYAQLKDGPDGGLSTIALATPIGWPTRFQGASPTCQCFANCLELLV